MKTIKKYEDETFKVEGVYYCKNILKRIEVFSQEGYKIDHAILNGNYYYPYKIEKSEFNQNQI
jgi:hypothetical protein